MITRRTVLRAAAAVPIAAAAVRIEPVTPAAAALESAPAALRVEHPWLWWVGHGDDVFSGHFATRDEAYDYAARSEYSEIAECKQQDFSLEVDADDVLDRIADAQYDLIGEGEFISSTPEQRSDLSERLTRVMYEWAADNKIVLTAWTFCAVRNKEYVDPPEQQRNHAR